jgi:hypothetical protein
MPKLMPGTKAVLRNYASLALISFVLLYLELVVIRWLASEIRIFAYFKNFPLLATFLGFGIGCILAPRARNYFRFAPWLLLALVAVICFATRGGYVHITFIDPFEYYTLGEWKVTNPVTTLLTGFGVLSGIFALVVVLFISLGEKLGQCFNDVKPLAGYTVNVAFSLLGGLFYAVLTSKGTGPLVWMAFATLLLLPFFWKSKATLLVFPCLLLLPWFLVPKDVIWSPYYRIDVVPVSFTANNGTQYMIGHNVNVNHDGIMSAFDGTPQFAQSLPPEIRAKLLDYFNVPYRLFGPNFEDVMVLGAGSGNDVSAALRNGATSIDAVEIDPSIANIGRQIHPEHPYQSDKVHLYIMDGRAFLRDPVHSNYDLIVFGALDSHTVFSSMSSIRLDNYVYTVESFQETIKRLGPHGVIAVTFYFFKQFQLERVYNALWRANGTKPVIVHSLGNDSNNLVMLAGPGADRNTLLKDPYVIAQNAEDLIGKEAVEPTTDDWPFLFLHTRGFPAGYVSIFILILGFSFLAINRAVQVTDVRCDWPMLLLGVGFMLLETKLIAKLALLLGTTWTVNTFVISAVLVMILLANLTVSTGWKWATNPVLCLVPLLVLILADWLLKEHSLALSTQPGKNVMLVLLFLALPVFFAGLVFATLYQRSKIPSVAFGYNLFGALVGGVLEYSSTAIGINNLNLLCLAVYGALAVMLFRGRGAHPDATTPELTDTSVGVKAAG